jgi:hypothetical protein
MKKITLAIVLSLVLLLSIVGPASAITDGTKDGDGHPYVVLLLMDVGGKPAFRCSATLINPWVVVTAGHCASNFPDSEYTGMRIFTESDVENGDNTYPKAGSLNSIEAVAWYAHPLYPTAPFFYHDVGVVILSEPYYLDEYGQLPTVNQLDALKTKRGQKDVTFTSVGYGMQKSFPTAADWKDVATKIRMVAHPKLNQINVPGSVGDFSLLLSNNAKTGGTCFGDSGGPNFLGDSSVIAGVTSFGKNGNCAGSGGVFRLDRADVLEFINSHINDRP